MLKVPHLPVYAWQSSLVCSAAILELKHVRDTQNSLHTTNCRVQTSILRSEVEATPVPLCGFTLIGALERLIFSCFEVRPWEVMFCVRTICQEHEAFFIFHYSLFSTRLYMQIILSNIPLSDRIRQLPLDTGCIWQNLWFRQTLNIFVLKLNDNLILLRFRE